MPHVLFVEPKRFYSFHNSTRKKMADSTSLLGTAQKIVEHGLETSPTTGNGYGLILGFSLFINIALVLGFMWYWRYAEGQKAALAKEYVGFLKSAKSAAESRANKERERNGD
jgi:hypothetical protein